MVGNMSKNSQTLEVTAELLQKYDKAGPRYTSYPTAPEWNPEFSDEDYRAALARAAQTPDEVLSMYVHLPFCWERCLFCGCNVVISKRQDVSDHYLEYLYREIEMAAAALGGRNHLKQMHWGGGTPTYLSVAQIRELFGVVNKYFQFVPDSEIALEVDPRKTSHEQLVALRELGFNRISMGVQDLDPNVQAVIKRNQSEEETRRLFAWSRELGFGGINLDLIYGLPEQTLATWEKTIRATIDIRPDRLAVYNYAHLPNMIKHQRRLEEYRRPQGAEKIELFALARRLFEEAGYAAIGMDHFALPEDELAVAMRERRLHRNFMGYTVVPCEDMVSFGTSAIGEIGGVYAQNEKRPVMYYKGLDEGKFPIHTGIKLSKDDEIRRWVIRQLMCNFYLDTAELKRKFGIHYGEYFAAEEHFLAGYYAEGFLTKDGNNLKVLPLGEIFVRNICMEFDAYLKKPESHRAFSRTV